MTTHARSALLAVLAAVAAAAHPGGTAPARAQEAAKPAGWQFPVEISAAGRKMSLREPMLLARDASSGEVKLRFPAEMLDGAGRITWGAVELTGKSHLDLSSRLFLVDGVRVAGAALPQLPDKDREEVTKALPDAVPKELTLRLDLITASPGAAPPEPATPPKLSMSGPEILVRRTPAVLVQIDGEIAKETVADFPFEYVLNTAADLFRDPKSDTWYLLLDGWWVESKSLQGPWKIAAQTPIVLSQLPISHPRGHVRLFVPGTPEYAKRTGGKKREPPKELPEIIVRDKPAELLLLAGDPLLMFVPGGKLQVVANTASDVLYHGKTEKFYLLVSGRWFLADDVNGPWKEAFGGLPEEFGRIPRDHVRAHVVWSVPGTHEAAEAAALAMLEERVTISPGTSTQVKYDGKELRTLPIEGTQLKVVANTDDDVFAADGAYWCCARGLWFRSDDGRTNWALAAKLPAALDELSESSGAYQVRFCRALGKVESGFSFGVTRAYSGVFLWKGSPVHGTGYSRRGLLRDGNWYPAPRTWGENRWYDPLAGVFQPRTVTYDAGMNAVAAEWSPYTASYGRVKWFASRYDQGGRRMFPFSESAEAFDPSAARPDPFETWGTQIKERDGLRTDRFPLGDRTAEAPPKSPTVVADEKGTVWRAGEKGLETFKDGRWAPGEGISALEKVWIDTFARLDARPAQLRAWAEKRRAPLPVNPTITR